MLGNDEPFGPMQHEHLLGLREEWNREFRIEYQVEPLLSGDPRHRDLIPGNRSRHADRDLLDIRVLGISPEQLWVLIDQYIAVLSTVRENQRQQLFGIDLDAAFLLLVVPKHDPDLHGAFITPAFAAMSSTSVCPYPPVRTLLTDHPSDWATARKRSSTSGYTLAYTRRPEATIGFNA